MVGYATVYTMAPVFSLVLDRDVSEDLALIYPELYKELTKVGSITTHVDLTSSLTSVTLIRVELCLLRRSLHG